jgi:flagellar hook-basal body complex protein FliE
LLPKREQDGNFVRRTERDPMQSTSISNAIAGLGGGDWLSVGGAGSAGSAGGAKGAGAFAGLLKNAISGVQGLENQAAAKVEGLMTGQGVDVHQAMIATEKADLSFEMALAVRNKAVAAYQQVMQMQF